MSTYARTRRHRRSKPRLGGLDKGITHGVGIGCGCLLVVLAALGVLVLISVCGTVIVYQ